MSFKQLLSSVVGYPIDRERRIRIASYFLAGGLIAIAYWFRIIHYGQLDRSWSSLSWILWHYHLGAYENHFWFIVGAYLGFVVRPFLQISTERCLKSGTISAMALPAFVVAFFVLTRLIMPGIQFGAYEKHFWFIVGAYLGFVVRSILQISTERCLKSGTISAMALPAFVVAFFVLTRLIMPGIQY